MTESSNAFQRNLETVSKETGMDVPVEVVSLPSKGLIYPAGLPLCGEEKVEIRCMTAREEDILTSPALIKQGIVLSKLIEACLLNKSVDPDDLIIGDRNALLISIRVTGYGSEYSVKVKCDACGDEYDGDFSLTGLTVKPLSATPLQPNTNLFLYKLPSCGAEVQFKLLTAKDENEISQTKERNKKISQVEKGITLRLFNSVVSFNGETDKQKISQKINNLRASDARALRTYIKDISPNIDMKKWSKCTKCGVESEVEIPLGISFFWPDFND